MEEATFALTSLLDSLPGCENKLTTIEQIDLVLSGIPLSTLECIVPKLSFVGLFECLTLHDRDEQLEACCSLLSKLLNGVDATVSLSKFQQELLIGLGCENESICNFCLLQVFRYTSSEGSDDHIAEHFDIFRKVIHLIASSHLSSSKLASKIVIELGKTIKGLQFLLARSDVLSCFDDVIKAGDVESFRVYECLMELSVHSVDGLRHVDESGLMRRLLVELENDDILCRLNCLDLLTMLAVTIHGCHYLHEREILGLVNDMIGDCLNPSESLLLPGMLKLFGSVSILQPSSVFLQYRKFVKCLFDLVNGHNSTSIIAIETIGFIAKTPEGKLTLGQEDEMKTVCTRLGVLIVEAPTDVRVKALDTVNHLMDLSVPHRKSHDLLSLTEAWFCGLTQSVEESVSKVLSIIRQPFVELRVGGLQLLATLVQLEWCQLRLLKRAGFLEYLLDRSTERGYRAGLEAKYDVIMKLASCECAEIVLSSKELMLLRDYVQEGPYYFKYESHVTFENSD